MDMIRQEVSGMARGDTNISYGGVTVNIYSQPGRIYPNWR